MKKEVFKFKNMQYIVRYPNTYIEQKKYPVIFFLHGAGGRGNDIHLVHDNMYFAITEQYIDFPFITVAPQCCKNTWFDMFETLQEFVKFVVTKVYADPKQVYLMGVSMGGYATWQLAMSMPDYFAAICPICGGGMYWNAERLLNVPVWAFHGDKDETVLVEESVKMVNAVNSCGGHAKLTVYPENGHDAWSDTYRNQEVFEWLLSNVNQNDVPIINKYTDVELYG